MAYEVGNHAISVPASADLSAKQFLFGTIGATGGGGDRRGPCRGRRDRRQARCGGPSVRALHHARQVVKVMCGAAVANGALLEADASWQGDDAGGGQDPRRRHWPRVPGTGAIIPALLILQR